MKIIILLLLVINIQGISQEYYNNVIELDNSVFVSTIIKFNDELLIPFHFSVDGTTEAGILKVDDLNNHIIKECNNATFIGAGLLNVNDCIYKPALLESSSNNSFALQKLTQDLSTAWTKEYVGLGEVTTVARSLESKGKIYLLSQDDFQSNHRETNIKKIDTDGNEEYSVNIGVALDRTFGWGLDSDLDDNIIVSVGTFLQEPSIGRYGQLYKIDGIGNISLLFTTEEAAPNGADPYHIAVLKNGLIVQSMELDRKFPPDFMTISEPTLIQFINENGDKINEVLLDHYKFNESVTLYKILDGQGEYFFLVGELEGLEDKEYGVVIKMDYEGNIIWERRISKSFILMPDSWGYFLDIIEGENGDLTILGTVNQEGKNKPWIVKLNSQGCFDSANCDTFLVANKKLEIERNIEPYPNPFLSNISFNEDVENLILFDLLGNQITYLDKYFYGNKIDLSILSSGIYFGFAQDLNGKTVRFKLIKQ